MMRWFRRKNREHDLEREIRADLELEAEEQRERGLAPEEARYAARRAFGNVTYVKEEVHQMAQWNFAAQLWQDARYAVRALRGNPLFSAAAIVSLALGIGANTAIFSLMDALLLRFLPVRNPGELVELMWVQRGVPIDSFSYPPIAALAARKDIFAGLAGFSGYTFNVASGTDTMRVPGALVTGEFYSMLGVEPFAGRLLTPDDDRPGAPPAAVLSYAYWKSHFGGDLSLIGRTIEIEHVPVLIAGISPREFDGTNIGSAANLTLPLNALAQLFPERARNLEAGSQWLRVLARPQPGISMAQAKARLAVVWPRIVPVATTPRMMPARRDTFLHSSIDLIPGGAGWSSLRRRFEQPLYVLLAITGLVLLIACANFANLLVARGAARTREIALRFAIGAGRQRVVRQLLTESVLLSVAGAALGMILAGPAGRLLVAVLSTGGRDPIALDLAPDTRVLLFASALALATGILFGLVPALRATAASPAFALKSGSGIAPRTRTRLLPALVVSQVALSTVLLIGAGLFVRTLQNLEQLAPGFRSEGVLLVNLDPRRAGYKDSRLTALYEELLDRFARLPGVGAASLSSNTPLSGGIWSEPVSINGQPLTKESAHINLLAPRFFETLGTPILLGRDFNSGDRAGAPGVAVVSEAFARKFLEGPPLGQRISIPGPKYSSFEIVGVVKDTLSQSLRGPAPPAMYFPAWQYPEMIGAAYFELHVDGSLLRTTARVQDELRARFREMPAQVLIEPLSAQTGRTLGQERTLATLGAAFGVLALILSAVGLYGLLAYMVARSTSEIGIRIALGAPRADVLAMILKGALKLLALGIAIGIPMAWAGSRWIASLLFHLSGTDPWTAAIAAGLLLITALTAALLPALRAARVDPLTALRYE
jgi:predicted permease